jgi:hypothetical protein
LAPCIAIAERNVDSALRKASQAGDLAEMQHQLDLGAEPNQAYALFAAVQGNQLAAVNYLIAHGADRAAAPAEVIRPDAAAAKTSIVTVHKSPPPIVGGGMASHP